MKAQTMKRIGTTLIAIGLAGAYYTIATMNNRGGAIALDFAQSLRLWRHLTNMELSIRCLNLWSGIT